MSNIHINRYVAVTRNLVRWYKHDPSFDQSDTELLGCALLTHPREMAIVGATIHINTFQGISVSFLATNSQEAQKWIDELQLRIAVAVSLSFFSFSLRAFLINTH
jgi:hypothetical protein